MVKDETRLNKETKTDIFKELDTLFLTKYLPKYKFIFGLRLHQLKRLSLTNIQLA